MEKPKLMEPAALFLGKMDKGAWTGRCENCGWVWYFLPPNDQGVCGLCGCASVVQLSAGEIMSLAPAR